MYEESRLNRVRLNLHRRRRRFTNAVRAPARAGVCEERGPSCVVAPDLVERSARDHAGPRRGPARRSAALTGT